MTDKTYIVTHPKARGLVTVTGKSLKSALESEGLNPDLWKLAEVPKYEEVDPDGNRENDAGHEDN